MAIPNISTQVFDTENNVLNHLCLKILVLSEMVYLLNGTLHEVYFLLVLFFPWGK